MPHPPGQRCFGRPVATWRPSPTTGLTRSTVCRAGFWLSGPGEEAGTVTAFWGDSWHQHPSPRLLEGTADGGVLDVGYEYEAGWWWRIIVDVTAADALQLRMDNVVPESAGDADFAGGAYSAMIALFTRAAG